MAALKAAKKHREHRAVPHNKIAKMWYEGKTYLQIGKAIDRLAPKGDLTKPVRAIISRMLNQGWDDEGKNVILKPREGMRAIGVGKTAPGNGTAAKKTVTPAAKKTVTRGRKPGSNGPAVVIALVGAGKFVRMEVGKAKALPKTSAILPSLIAVVQKAGYTVTQNQPEPASGDATILNNIEQASENAPETAPAPETEPQKETPIEVPATEAVPETPTTETQAA